MFNHLFTQMANESITGRRQGRGEDNLLDFIRNLLLESSKSGSG